VRSSSGTRTQREVTSRRGHRAAEGARLDAGRHYPEKFLEQVNAALRERYRSEDNFVVAFWNPSLYLNRETIADLAIDRIEAERALAAEILEVSGIALAMTRADLMAGTITDNPITGKAQRAFHPKLSGDVLIVQDQFWYLFPTPRNSRRCRLALRLRHLRADHARRARGPEPGREPARGPGGHRDHDRDLHGHQAALRLGRPGAVRGMPAGPRSVQAASVQ
jgi:ribosomal protein L20